MRATVRVTCPCGAEFSTSPHRLALGRGKFCSKPCMYRHRRPRPPGLVYKTKPGNSETWFRPGQEPWNKGKRGSIPWNKGIPSGVAPSSTAFQPGDEPWNKGVHTGVVPPAAFKPGEQAGEANWRWAGGVGSRCQDRPGYQQLHRVLYAARGSATAYPCARADATCKGPMEWANISHEYRDTDDFMPLCRSHHARYDGGLL